MNPIRIGVVGCGVMGQGHLRLLAENPAFKITAACDGFEANLTKACEAYGATGFTTPQQMLDSGQVEAIVIATPHYSHVPITVQAIERNIHVLCEKPLAVTAQAARQAIAAHQKNPKVVFAMNHQMRAEPKWQLAKKILASGELGEIQRVTWLVTTWFRTQAYYNSGTWRATWAGEGGGVLLNQCPHQLDLLWWLAGSPSRVTAKVNLSKFHKIEVEDDVTAILEYPNGATGVFITSTGDLVGTNRLDIACDRGRLVIQGDKDTVEVTHSGVSGKDYRENSPVAGAGALPGLIRTVHECPPGQSVKPIHQNFADAIRQGVPVIAPGTEGVHAVDLGNAMLYSGLRQTASSYPTDGAAYDQMLAELIENAKNNPVKK